jgi:hypothetical protein
MGLGMSSSALWCLLCRPTGRWFHFARDLRLEHRAARDQMDA